GAGLSIAGLVILIVISAHHGNPIAVTTSAIYGSLAIILYTISCIYHSLSPKLEAKKVLRVIDHCNVFLLVAGTYTPITLVCFNDTIGWIVFALVWIITIIGIVLTAINVDKYQVPSVICHLLSGWLIVFAWEELVTKMDINGIILLILGGLAYTIGAILYGLGSKIKYMHSVFHFFVLLGSILHFLTICLYVV
ncbi:MAG: hemolysin III family protein, partial [Bacilli bacterium]|nr:hemolysin III family protein [Bacilli bacterium]